MLSINNSPMNTKVPGCAGIEELPNISTFLTLLEDIRDCYISKLESDEASFDDNSMCYQISNLGKHLEEVLARLPARGHPRDLLATLRSKILSLWNDTVQLKIRSGIKGNSKSVLLLRSIAMSLFVALLESESEIENFITSVTMAHKVSSGWLEFDESLESRTRARNALQVAANGMRRLQHIMNTADGPTGTFSGMGQAYQLAIQVLFLKLEMAQLDCDASTWKKTAEGLQECIHERPQDALEVAVRSFNRAVQFYQKRSFDRAAVWCELCCRAAGVKNVVIEPANFAKMFELWGTILVDGDCKDHLPIAFEAIKKANLTKPSLSSLYTQLRIALKNKVSVNDVENSVEALFSSSFMIWSVVQPSVDLLISGLQSWEKDFSSNSPNLPVLRLIPSYVSKALGEKFGNYRDVEGDLVSIQVRLLLFADQYDSAKELLEKLISSSAVDRPLRAAPTLKCPPHAALWDRAEQLLKAERPGEAAQWFNLSLSLMKNFTPAASSSLLSQVHRNLAFCCLSAGSLQAAAESLDRAAQEHAKTAPSAPHVNERLLRFQLLLRENREMEAAVCLEQFLLTLDKTGLSCKDYIFYALQLALESEVETMAVKLLEHLMTLPDVAPKTAWISALVIMKHKCKAIQERQNVDVEAVLPLLEKLAGTGGMEEQLSEELLQLRPMIMFVAHHTTNRNHQWCLFYFAYKIATSPENKTTCATCACICGILWIREVNQNSPDTEISASEEKCRAILELSTLLLDPTSEYKLDAEKFRQVLLCRLEVLIFLNEPSMADAVQQILDTGDLESCTSAAHLLFHYRHKEDVFLSAEKIFIKLTKDASLKSDPLATIEAYKNLIQLHVERFGSSPGDANNGVLSFAETLQQTLCATGKMPPAPAAMQWIVATLWNLGVRHFSLSLADGNRPGPSSFCVRTCTRAWTLMSLFPDLRVLYETQMNTFFVKMREGSIKAWREV